jgi:hypothetical protein
MKSLLATFAAASALLVAAPSFAGVVVEAEPNDSFATAQSINGHFTLDANSDISDSTTIPHVTIRGAAGNGTYDYYSFSVGAGARGIFDIDYAMPNFDAYLDLFDSSGVSILGNDDASIALGGTGSVHPFDSYIDYTFANAGTYYARVGNCCVGPQTGGTGYQLQVSITDQSVAGPVPEPATWAMMIVGFGAAGGMIRQRRKPVNFAAA